MSAVYDWIITITGASILFGIFEIVLPDGQMNGFIKSVFGIIFIYVVISPVLNFVVRIYALIL